LRNQVIHQQFLKRFSEGFQPGRIRIKAAHKCSRDFQPKSGSGAVSSWRLNRCRVDYRVKEVVDLLLCTGVQLKAKFTVSDATR
jgi:hypothetical protein